MEYRYLGRSGLQVSALSLGGWLTYGGKVDLDATVEIMKLAFEHGINFFDTAEVYAEGKSELVMGEAIKKLGWKRSSYVLATKLYWGGKGVNESGLSRKHIVEGMNASLQRLQLPYVDLIFAHRPDDLTPMEEIVRSFNWLIDQGKAFYWGTSEWSAEQIADAHRIAEKLNLIGPLMEQPQYNMFHRERFEKEYKNLYRKYGLGTTIWSPLAGGVLTGKYNEGIPEGSRFDMKNNWIVERYKNELASPEGQVKIQKVKQLQGIAQEFNASVTQLAIAWCLKNPNVSTVILGASKTSQLLENLKSLELLDKLTPNVMEQIEKILTNAPKQDPERF